MSDHGLEDLAVLPLQWLSLAETGAGDQGIAQLLAMPLAELNLSNTRTGDDSWPVLAQLPLKQLDLSSSKVTCSSVPEGEWSGGMGVVRCSAADPGQAPDLTLHFSFNCMQGMTPSLCLVD